MCDHSPLVLSAVGWPTQSTCKLAWNHSMHIFTPSHSHSSHLQFLPLTPLLTSSPLPPHPRLLPPHTLTSHALASSLLALLTPSLRIHTPHSPHTYFSHPHAFTSLLLTSRHSATGQYLQANHGEERCRDIMMCHCYCNDVTVMFSCCYCDVIVGTPLQYDAVVWHSAAASLHCHSL